MTSKEKPVRVDPRDKVWSAAISRYRKAKQGTSYAEAARAVCFDEPWRSEVQKALADLSTGEPGE